MASLNDKQLLKLFGECLHELRARLNLTQEQVAEEIGVASNTYASWERGKNAPRLAQIINLADFYKVGVNDLLLQAKPIQTSFIDSGIKWRLTWSEPEPNEKKSADIWHRLIKGEKNRIIAEELNLGHNDIENYIQDLIIHERIYVEQVARNRELEEKLRQHFKYGEKNSLLRDVRVANLSHIDSRMVQFILLGYVAKQYFLDEVHSGDNVGFCGGFAVSRMIYSFRRGECPRDIRVYPVAVSPVFEMAHISANSLVGAMAYRHFGRGIIASELPFFSESTGQLDAPPSRIAQRILEDAAAVDFIFMGIGDPGRGALARGIHDMRQDYLWLSGLDPEFQKNSNAVGNILYYLVDETGKPPVDFKERNEKLVCSIGLQGLQRIVSIGKKVVTVSIGEHKTRVVRTAIQSGYTNVLIIDDSLAKTILAT